MIFHLFEKLSQRVFALNNFFYFFSFQKLFQSVFALNDFAKKVKIFMFWKIQGELVEVPKNKISEIYHISQIFNGFEDSFDRVRTYTQAAERFLSLCGKSICADSFLDISKLIQRFFKRSFFHTFYSKTDKNIDFSPKLKTFKLNQDFSKDRFFPHF